MLQLQHLQLRPQTTVTMTRVGLIIMSGKLLSPHQEIVRQQGGLGKAWHGTLRRAQTKQHIQVTKPPATRTGRTRVVRPQTPDLPTVLDRAGQADQTAGCQFVQLQQVVPRL